MGTNYEHLTAEERATLMVMRADGCSQRAVARCLGRSPSTISRELARNASCGRRGGDTTAVIPYDASLAGKRALVLRQEPRQRPKLAADTALFAVILKYLREGWSPEQIAGRLKRAWPDDQSKTVSHETIYTALYAMPRGGLRKDLIACLRHGRAKRRPRSRGHDRRGQISDMLSLHVRPPEVEDRLVPGHWEGDLIKGARNQSAVGTLVERTSRLVLLARMEGATAEAALAGFTCILNRVHMPVCHLSEEPGTTPSSFAACGVVTKPARRNKGSWAGDGAWPHPRNICDSSPMCLVPVSSRARRLPALWRSAGGAGQLQQPARADRLRRLWRGAIGPI